MMPTESCFALALLVAVAAHVYSAEIEGMYVFRDSLVDPGNNRYLLTTAQADFFPNGIDFLGGRMPTGRFSNGMTAVDLIAQELGLPLIPGYHKPATKGSLILKGVSYASGGARISNETGSFLTNVEPLGKQLDNFAKTISQMVALLGSEASAASHLSKSIVLFALGSNDYLNFINNTKGETPESFQDHLVSNYQNYIKHAYNLGARKVVVIGLGPFGCIPSKRVGNVFGANGKACDENLNKLAVNTNKALLEMVQSLNQQLTGVNMIFGTTYDFFLDGSNNPSKYGFVNANSACCGVSRYKLFACLPGGSVCSNRTEYLYWDVFHPTEAANKIVARALLDGGSDIMYPINIRQLSGI